MLKVSALTAWAELQISSVRQSYLKDVIKPHKTVLHSLWVGALRDYSLLRTDPDSESVSSTGDMIHSRLGREVLLPVSSICFNKDAVRPLKRPTLCLHCLHSTTKTHLWSSWTLLQSLWMAETPQSDQQWTTPNPRWLYQTARSRLCARCQQRTFSSYTGCPLSWPLSPLEILPRALAERQRCMPFVTSSTPYTAELKYSTVLYLMNFAPCAIGWH
jgi:hypothetical protein